MPKSYQRTCPNCQTEYKTSKKIKVYCSNSCKYEAWAKINRPKLPHEARRIFNPELDHHPEMKPRQK